MSTPRSRRFPAVLSLVLGSALILSACGSDSPTDVNTQPQANAGQDRVLATGSLVTLDATGSSDSDGDPLTYSWSLTTPAGSVASLSSATAAMPTFTADVAGTYTVELAVSDGSATTNAVLLVTAVDAYCDAIVNLFPTPVRAATSPFADTDDAFINVAFDASFDFTFFGQTYGSVYLNTNGGMTFGEGLPVFDPGAPFIFAPTIAPFWGDMDPAAAETRPAQMYYEACSDRFIVYYQDFQDLDVASWDNTATVTLFEDGTIVFDYGEVGSEDIMVGVFDGTHLSDTYVAVQDSYVYGASSGTLLFDPWGNGLYHLGQLTDRTITFDPTP